MSTQIFSKLDLRHTGPGLLLSQGGLVITTGLSNLDINRKALGTVPLGTGESQYEGQFFTNSKPVALPAGCAMGFATTDSDLTQGAGQDGLSWAYEPNSGLLLNNGGDAGIPAQTSTEAQVISMHLRFDGHLNAFIGVSIDGSFVGEINTGVSGVFWVPCVTVCLGDAGDSSAYFVFGQTAFNYPRIEAGV